ncbi:MAG: DNA/RNA nuclease SfsA [Thermaceae bacterium]
MDLFLPWEGPLKPCVFLERPNRFLVRTDRGLLHLPNSGRMRELLRPGAPCLFLPRPTPRTLGRMVLVKDQGVWVGVDAHRAGRLLELLLHRGWFGRLEALRREAPILGERLDFWARIEGEEKVFEAKNCNRLEGGMALFPDAPSLRGARHLRVLARFGPLGYAVWFVQHPLARSFALDPEDQELYRAAKEAKAAGTHLLAFLVEPSREGLRVRKPLPFRWA